jgi:sulfatase maturation enzyme AslB (radical SAM superfamily)
MLNLGKFILKRMLLDTEKLMFALPRMFPPSEPKLTALRIKNFISSYLNWKFGLKSKLVTLQVEPVKGCNLNCIMCGAGQLKIQKLPFDNFIAPIGYDGELYTCCRHFGNKEASLGNILKDPQRALKNRLMFLKKFRSDPPDFCKNCETYCRMCKKNGKA